MSPICQLRASHFSAQRELSSVPRARRLTLRSSRRVPAGRFRPSFHSRPCAPCLHARLNSNVKRHKQHPGTLGIVLRLSRPSDARRPPNARDRRSAPLRRSVTEHTPLYPMSRGVDRPDCLRGFGEPLLLAFRFLLKTSSNISQSMNVNAAVPRHKAICAACPPPSGSQVG